MAQCARCKAETDLFESGVPICVECSEARAVKRKPVASAQEIRTTLLQELLQATARNSEAAREFDEVMGQFPSGLPDTDGVQRVANASKKLSGARKEMATAHNRLNDYLGRGIVPEDLRAAK